MKKLAIITSHPIQYYAPWFRHLSHQAGLQIRVFYLWDFGITQQTDRGFGQSFQWDIPLLEGYDYEFVPNCSSRPGTCHFWGLNNPTLPQQLRHFGPDAVLLMNYNYASLYSLIAQWRETPLLFRGDSHHLFPGDGPKEWLRRTWISLVYRRFQAILYVGQANYRYFRDHGVPAERLFYTPHAIENTRFQDQSDVVHQVAQVWKQELGIPVGDRVILFAGKFTTKKRPLDLLRAFQRLQVSQFESSQISLLFVGAGPLESELRSESSHPDCAGKVFFAPFQNQTQMPRTYAIADLVVLPSYGAGETWGLAINEAMCLGKPVIVSDHVGCAEDLVESGRNGLVVPAGDELALAEALQRALGDPDQLLRWGEVSRQKIDQFSYTQMTQGLLSALAAMEPSVALGRTNNGSPLPFSSFGL